MTQVRSSGGTAMAPFATPVTKGTAKAASQPQKKIAVPAAALPRSNAPSTGTAAPKPGTQVSFGQEALHALEATGEYLGKAVLTGIEDVGQAAYYTAKAVGTGVVDVAAELKDAVAAGVHGLATGVEETASAVGHGLVHVENAIGDVWGMATTGMSSATTLATTLGNDAEAVVANVGNAATDVGIGAKAVLSGVGSVASTAAKYGTYVVKQAGKALNELT